MNTLKACLTNTQRSGEVGGAVEEGINMASGVCACVQKYTHVDSSGYGAVTGNHWPCGHEPPHQVLQSHNRSINKPEI